MTNFYKPLTSIAAVMALALSSGVAAQGGGYGQQQSQPGQQGQSPAQQAPQAAPDPSDEELRSFAEAQEEVTDISEKYQGKIQNTQDPDKMAKIRQRANQEMIQAVQQAGLEPSRYNSIAAAVRNDSELANKVEAMQ